MTTLNYIKSAAAHAERPELLFALEGNVVGQAIPGLFEAIKKPLDLRNQEAICKRVLVKQATH
jgi:hypothetical protein